MLRLLDLECNAELRVYKSERQSFHPKGYIVHSADGHGDGVRRTPQPEPVRAREGCCRMELARDHVARLCGVKTAN